MGILVDMKKNTVVLQKPSGTIAIRVDITAEQRKFYNSLLFIAKETIKKNKDERHYSISLNELKKLLAKSEQDKNNLYYKEKIEELMHKIAEYNILGKDKIDGKFVLISHIMFVEDQKSKEVIVNFEVPEFVRERLIDPQNGMYANINLVVLRGLTSKYAIILYEIAKDYERVEIPLMTLEECKKLFGVDKINSYKRIDNFKVKVLDRAVNDLNNNPNIDFAVNYKLIRTGKVYTDIKFEVKPKTKKKMLQEYQETSQLKILLNAVPKEEQTKTLEAYLAKCLKNYDAKYLIHQIEYVTQQKPKSFFAYLKQAIKEDYANSEKAEIEKELEKKRIQEAIERELENAREEIEHDISVKVDNEKFKIYDEYMNLLNEAEKQALQKEYLQKAKEIYPNVDEKSFYMEFKIQQLLTEDIIIKNEIYQKRLSRVEEQTKEKAQKELEKAKYNILVKYGQIQPK